MFCLSSWLGFISHDVLKYLISAGTMVLVTHVLLTRFVSARKIQRAQPDRRQITREIGWSVVSAVIFGSVSLGGVFGLAELGWNRLYLDIAAYGWGYAGLCLLAMIIAHDAYFYWLHRLLHVPLVLRFTHRLHHRSRTPTPWAAYSFDPIEAVLQVAFAPLWAVIVPVHPLVLLVWSIHMVARNVIGHCGFELFPRTMARSRWFGWLTGVTHHDLHHQDARSHFGLYFTWWDRWMGTERSDYVQRFEAAARSDDPAAPAGTISGMIHPALANR